MKKLLLISIVFLVSAGVVWAYLGFSHHSLAPVVKNRLVPAPVTKATPKPAAFNINLYSHSDPSSIWVIVDKLHPLIPADYVPSDLVTPDIPLRVPGNQTMQVRQVAAAALESMFSAAKAQGINLMLASGYRSYSYQLNLYNGYVHTQGKSVADLQSARPGYSEHQTGLAIDLEPVSRNCELQQCFASTPEGQWLSVNSYKYGFIIRYPKNAQSITGYEYEPWHVRYIGVPAATEMHRQNVPTLEQFFGYPAAPSYSN